MIREQKESASHREESDQGIRPISQAKIHNKKKHAHENPQLVDDFHLHHSLQAFPAPLRWLLERQRLRSTIQQSHIAAERREVEPLIGLSAEKLGNLGVIFR